MASTMNKVKIETPDEVETEYLNIIAPSQGSEDADPSNLTTVITVNDEIDPGATYFVDEEGRYYYQPSADAQNIVFAEGVADNGESSHLVVEGEDSYQTVTLVPSETPNGELSYVLVVQEPDEKLKSTIELEPEQQNDDDVYDFNQKDEVEDEDGSEDNKEHLNPLLKVEKKRRRCRPQFTCTYCKYTSPRRYLLFRHMKSHSNDRPHRCHVCERGFKTVASLQNHVNTHNGVKPHMCKQCDGQFTTSGELVRHIRYKHTHEKPHKCSECDYASVELSKLRRHIRCHTGERPYQCPHCTYASPDTFKFKRHLRSHTGEKPYKCEYCAMRFTKSNLLKSHKLIHNFTAKPVHACELCPTTCGRKSNLRIHVQKLHSSDKPYKCKRCGKSFPDRYSCKVHTKTHEGEKCFKCDECPYASTTLRHLNSHMLKHTNEKPFTCDECNASFRQKQLLRRHQNLYHNPNFPYKCEYCEMRFTQSNSLKNHKLIHNFTVKPVYACDLCPTTCGRKTDLRIHVQKLHTSDKPYKCKRCSKSFPDRYFYKVHTKTHEGEKCFKCDVCPYASTTLRHLNSHMLKHTNEKPFTCDECNASFRQKQLLRRHQNLYHNPNFVPTPPKEKTHECHECNRQFAHKGGLIRHLAVHDPESGHQERALALRLGREKRIMYVEADPLEQQQEGSDEETMDPTNETMKTSELMTVATENGQRYVVLEVIQLPDGTEQAVTEVDQEFYMVNDDTVAETQEEEQRGSPGLKANHIMKDEPATIKIERDVEACFGFDEEEEAEDDEDEIH